MKTQATAMVLASFVGDSLSLGAHWIYDTAVIDQTIGRVDTLRAPLPDSYHAGKQNGQFTHYGDQTLVLLEAVAQDGAFSLTGFAAAWQRLFADYQGYIDKATSATLDNLKRNLPLDQCGSSSTDLGGAARIAPLVYRYRHDRQALLAAARRQTAFTHNHPATLAGADFIARTTWQVLQGSDPVAAMEAALSEGMADVDLADRIREGLKTKGQDTRTVIKEFGQVCGITAALPGAVHLILNYSHDLETALIENTMAGGDSAARGLVAGMILGASLGEEALPAAWLSGMQKSAAIRELLGKIDNQMQTPAAL